MTEEANITNTDSHDDDEAAMRLAFEAFMLSGKKELAREGNGGSSSYYGQCQGSYKQNKKKNKKKTKQSGTDSNDSARVGGDEGCEAGNHIKKTESASTFCSSTIIQRNKSKSATATDKKRYFQLLRSFNDKMQSNWFEMDDQMLSLLENIVSIRERLPMEWKLLNNESCSSVSLKQRGDWKQYGFLGKPKEIPYSLVHLQVDDIQLALSNDVIQHEKMLVELRKLMSQLADCQDTMGRIVDTMWHFHLEYANAESANEEDYRVDAKKYAVEHDRGTTSRIVQAVTKVFQMLSMELYRKQSLVSLVIESTKDELFGIEDDEASSTLKINYEGLQLLSRSPVINADGGDYGNGNSTRGLQAARKCWEVWKRSSRETFIDMRLISTLIKLGGEGRHGQ